MDDSKRREEQAQTMHLAANMEAGEAAASRGLLSPCQAMEGKGSPCNSPLNFTHVVASSRVRSDAETESFPESIYGAGMSFIVQSASTSNRRVHWLSLLIACAMLGNIVIQAFAIWSVKAYITEPAVQKTRSLYDEYHRATLVNGTFSQEAFDAWGVRQKDKLCQFPLSQPAFSLIILVIWTMSLVIELKETMLFSIWWLQLPMCNGSDVSMEKLPDDDDSIVVRSASTRMKAFVFGTILVPKLLIALVLWWLGARWLIATTDFEGLVLNAVALSFIVELDEMIFAAIMPHNAKKMLANFKLEVPHPTGDSNKKLHKWIGQMLGKCLLMVGVPVLYMLYFQQVLPGYKFDVHEHCAAYLHTQGL